MTDLSRRHLIGSGAALTALTLLPQPLLALTDAQARALIDQAVADINRVIASGQPLNAMIKQFEQIFRKYADVNIIAQSVLGQDAKRLNASQMQAFTAAFTGYISRKYGKRFNEFVGGKIETRGARKVKSWTEVDAVVSLRGEAPFDVKFLVSDRSGRSLFFDLFMEGISMRLSERTEITAMLDRRKGDINAVIADLKKAG